MQTRNTLPPVARVAILRAIRLLDSVAFVSQPGDAARPLATLRNAIELHNLAKRAPAAPDWEAIAAQHARQRDAAMAERDALALQIAEMRDAAGARAAAGFAAMADAVHSFEPEDVPRDADGREVWGTRDATPGRV